VRVQDALDILKSTFGYREFRHHQAEIVETLVNGRDALVLMPTGGGKSLCYQIPAMLRDGVGIVVSPLIALMQDQVEALGQLDIRAAFANSSMDARAQRQVENALLAGDLDLLYIAPERLLKEHTLNLLSRSQLALFAIDEAHCVSQWGHDFRREYQQLFVLHQRFPDIPRIALTATADARTRKEIVSQLDLRDAAVFVNSFDRPNIRYTINEGQNARDRLWRFIELEHISDAGIIYCLSRKKVQAVAAWLSAKGRTALPYHAGLSDETRRLHLQRFLYEDGVIIVATIAFGMGIDKPDVRFVAHLNLPKSIEAYYQETGRAGRDGQPANAWMAYGLQDVILLRQMSQESDADEQHKRVTWSKLEALLGLCEQTSCRRQSLLSYFGEQLDAPCGNCDNCLDPPETWDGTEAAQKVLSCVYRAGQRFGVNYIIDLLTGKADERILRNRHDGLSTFGIGTGHTAAEWRSIFRQLVAQGYLVSDMVGHGTLRLTEKARPLLRGEHAMQMRRQRRPLETKESKTVSFATLSGVDSQLFEKLRAHRSQLAHQRAIPPYIIFHDKTLHEMAQQRPRNENDLRAITGVGEKKLLEYGAGFLNIVEEFMTSLNVPES
jgi:ATP-dependent DNA helicase RecQ